MNKKLIAVAVAGVFGAPALALAQASTVQIYGKATIEYGYADQGAGRPKTDMIQAPGGSSIGFKGQEALGGGLSAWFQCESSADLRGNNQDGFCSRNSAIGFKGGFGNVHLGRWDTPFKRAISVGLVGAEDTGLLGSAFLLAGSSTGTAAQGGQATSVSLSRSIWKRRESSQIYYESPTFSGFQVLAAYSAANATAEVDATVGSKPRVQSLAGIYANGPLNIALGYERHNNFGAVGGGNDDRAFTLAGSYTFMGKVKVGASYIDAQYDTSSTAQLKKKNWMIGAAWNVSGPHNVEVAYVQAGDSKGDATTNPGLGGGNGPVLVPGTGSTGATLWELAYKHNFSKRTSAKLGYVRLTNDTNATYSLGGLKAPVTAGNDMNAWVTYVAHTF